MTISSYGSTVLSPFAYESTATATDFDTKVDEYNNASTTDSSAADANLDANAAAEDPNAAAGQTIGYYSLNIQFKSSLSCFKNFADNLTTNNEKSMVLENVNIENVNESEISGSMTLNMYVLKKLADPSAS